MKTDSAILKNIRWVRQARKKNWIDRFIIRLFRKVLLRWCDRHLYYSYTSRTINSGQLHSLDAQMKGDLEFGGYLKP